MDYINEGMNASIVQQTTTFPEQTLSPQNGIPFVAPTTIEIGAMEAFLGVAVILIGIGIAWGALKKSVSGIEASLENNIAPDLKNVRERFAVVEDRMETLWKDKYAPAHSPRKLNERGQNILQTSGIKEMVDEKKEILLRLVNEHESKNAYDAEMAIETVMLDLPNHCPDIIDQLKDGAFKTGSEVSAVLFVGSIYLRDLIFPELGFSLSDLDKLHKDAS